MHRSRRKCRRMAAYGGRRRYRTHFAELLITCVAGSDACAHRLPVFQKWKIGLKMKTLPPAHCATSPLLHAYYLHIFYFPKFRGDRSMCTRIYRWHYLYLLSAIGTLQCRGRDGSNFLETAKMCGFSSAASLPAALCAGGSVFILRAKRYSGGKMENGGFWRQASLPPTLCAAAGHACCW